MKKNNFLQQCNDIFNDCQGRVFCISIQDKTLFESVKVPLENNEEMSALRYIESIKKDYDINSKESPLEIPESIDDIFEDDDLIEKTLQKLKSLFSEETLIKIKNQSFGVYDLLIELLIDICPEQKEDLQKYMKLISDGETPTIDEKHVKPLTEKEIFVMSVFSFSITKLMHLSAINSQIIQLKHICQDV